MEMELAPVAASNTSGGVGPQPEVDGAVELLTVIPVGRSSVNPKFVRFVSPGATISNLSLALPPAGIVEGENDLIAVISVPLTVTVAVAEDRFPMPCAVVNVAGGMVLVNVPEEVPAGAVTGTDIVQVPGVVVLPAGIVPPVRLTLVDVVETAPGGTQVLVAAPLTINGLGRVSVTLTPV
jgi:hypothetical protein